jgi:hypothetical protein
MKLIKTNTLFTLWHSDEISKLMFNKILHRWQIYHEMKQRCNCNTKCVVGIISSLCKNSVITQKCWILSYLRKNVCSDSRYIVSNYYNNIIISKWHHFQYYCVFDLPSLVNWVHSLTVHHLYLYLDC